MKKAPGFIRAKASASMRFSVASVATGFPAGQTSLEIKVEETRDAVAAGAGEIDMVISREAYLSGDDARVAREIEAVKGDVEAGGIGVGADQRAVFGAEHGVDRADRGTDVATIIDMVERGDHVRHGDVAAAPGGVGGAIGEEGGEIGRLGGERLRGGEDEPLHLLHIGVVGHGEVDDDAGPALRHVADPQDLAVADVPDGAVDVAQPGDAQADRLDGPDGLPEVDLVADAVLVLEDHEDAGQEVRDQ